MTHTPIKRISREEVEAIAKSPEGSIARQALLEANLYDGDVNFYMVGHELRVVPKGKK